MKKTFRVLMILFVIAMIFQGTASAYEATSKTVRFTVNGGAAKEIETRATTVAEFLAEQKINVDPLDQVSPGLDATIQNMLTITYDDYIEVTLIVDGQKISYPVLFTDRTILIGNIVAEYSRKTGIEYAYSQALSNLKAKNGTVLELQSKTSKTFETINEIPFETATRENPDLDEGVTNVLVEGVAGQKKTVVKVNYLAGTEASRETVSDEIIVQPVNKVIEVGTAKVVTASSGKVFQYQKELVMSATAYTSNYECTGKNPGDNWFGVTASGMKAQVGVVAVDPKVIPLGTELYISGYGYAVAGDTGGAIKGNKIDLYYNTYGECLQFGRQNVTVYILK